MSEQIVIRGRINRIGEEKTFGASFRKVEVWLETDLESKYPQILSVEFTMDNIEKLNGFTDGETVEVRVNLRGRLHAPTDRVFNTITAWSIKRTESAPGENPPTQEPPADFDDDDDSIPF